MLVFSEYDDTTAQCKVKTLYKLISTKGYLTMWEK